MTDIKSNRENLSKMVLLSTATNMSNIDMNESIPSPTESYEEVPNQLFLYLQRLAGYCENEAMVLLKDHSYARPWNWKPENIYNKPVKKLFFSKPQTPTTSRNRNKLRQRQIIDVETVDSEPIMPLLDLEKSRQSMDEFQKLANFVRPEDNDDWEEKIEKIFWSPIQTRVFSKAVKILNSERLSRLSKVNHPLEPILRRTSIVSSSKKFREILASTNWDFKITQWLHGLFFDHLPQEYLAIYLDILQTLRQKIPQLIDKMIAVQPNINSKSNASWETFGPLLKKSWDPVQSSLNANKAKKLPGSPILIITPSGANADISSRLQKWINQLGALGTVINIQPHLGLNGLKMTMVACIEQLIQSTRAKIQETRVDYPGCPIILIGFNTGAALACQIAQMEHITAVVCLGFPFNTVDGKRGSPDDILVDMKCPVMFVIGQNSMIAKLDDVEDLREKMLVETSLVVVGSADDHLRISTMKKNSEKITQSMVDRCILYEIGDFLGTILIQPHPLPLRTSILNSHNSKIKGDSRKRKTSTSSSVESEPNSPSLKKIKSRSPKGASNNNINRTNLSTNANSNQSALLAASNASNSLNSRQKSRTVNSSKKSNFSEHLISAKMVSQQQNIDNVSGGITLNIGSLASLAPVGPIRLTPANINLNTPSINKSTNSNSKSSNTFINVSKNNSINIDPQNITKIKMLNYIPQKNSPRVMNTFRNTEKNSEMKLGNILTSTSNQIRVNPGCKTATGSTNILTNINSTKPITDTSNLINKSISTNVSYKPKITNPIMQSSLNPKGRSSLP